MPRKNYHRSTFNPKIDSSVWMQPGETMSIKNAFAIYGVTEDECRKNKLPCKWRSCHGNVYAVVKKCDVVAIKNKLNEEKENQLKAKLGDDGYKQHLQAEQDTKQRKRDKLKVQKLMQQLLSVTTSNSDIDTSNFDTLTITKSKAKTVWNVDAAHLKDLEEIVSGRNTSYKLKDVIQAALEPHKPKLSRTTTSTVCRGHEALMEELSSKKNGQEALDQYTSFLMNKLEEYPEDVLQEVCKLEIPKAELELTHAEANVRKLKVLTSNKRDEGSANKKRKMN